MIGVLIERGNLDTEVHKHSEKTPNENGGQNWDDASSSQEMPRMASKPPLGEAWNRLILTALQLSTGEACKYK